MYAMMLDGIEAGSPLYREWEDLVASNQFSGVMQSLKWADFKRRQGLDCVHIGVFDRSSENSGCDTLIGGAIFYAASRTHGAGFLVAPEGPVLPWKDTSLAKDGLRLIKEQCEQYARKHGMIAMRIEPRLPLPVPSLLREFGRAPADLVPRETLYLELQQSEEQLLAAMKPKCRYNIGLSRRHGVTISEESGVNTAQRFYAAMRQASVRDKFALEPLAFFEQLAETLVPAATARFLFAEHEGDLLGALLLLTHGTRATYLYGGITNTKRNLMGGYALQWAAIKRAKEDGCQVYDFYGFNEFQAPGHPYSRFSRFKKQFGGNVMRFVGAQDYFFMDCLADAFIKAANEAKLAEVSMCRT